MVAVGHKGLQEHFVIAHLVQDVEGGAGHSEGLVCQLSDEELHPVHSNAGHSHPGEHSHPPGSVYAALLGTAG